MLTKEQAMTVRELHHVTRCQGGGACYRIRRNGQTQTWKTRPGNWSMPVRWGARSRDQFRITQDEAADWADAATCPRCTQPPAVTDSEWLYGDSPAGLRMQAAAELAAEFGNDVSEWLV